LRRCCHAAVSWERHVPVANYEDGFSLEAMGGFQPHATGVELVLVKVLHHGLISGLALGAAGAAVGLMLSFSPGFGSAGACA